GSYEVYLNCRDQIEQGIASILRFITPEHAVAQAGNRFATSVAIGADRGGYDLKEKLKKHLERRGMSVADFGSNSREPADYPDYAQAVAHSVAMRKAEFGLLISTSDSVSLAANKVPGVRAALANDEHTAVLARQQNNANVLCLPGKTTAPEEATRIVDAFV